MLRGALAAAVTPLDGDRLDESAFGPYVDFLAAGGLDGLLALGTTGEGLLFGVDERKRALELFLEAPRGRLQVAAHCGAQTTADTVALAAHAAEAGVDAVAVIGPPYFQLDERSLLDHFEAAAAACAPLPFYVYEFERASGYAVPVPVLLELRERVANLAGLKVSDAPFDKFCALPGRRARRLRRAGGADLRRDPRGRRRRRLRPRRRVSGPGRGGRARAERGRRDRARRAARGGRAVSAACRAQVHPRPAGVPVREDVRRPLRQLSDGEREELRGWLESS